MNTFSIIEKERFIALARHVEVEMIGDLADALIDGGIRILEITFDPGSPDTLRQTAKAIETAATKGILIGAGTVFTEEAVNAAYSAGAQFIVSPNTDERVINRTKALGMLSIPGAYTPNEIVNAWKLGADIVKIFPVLPHQLDYVKVLTSPLSHIDFMITGGVNPENIADFLATGAIAVAAGATLVKPDLVKSRNWHEITILARKHLEAIEKRSDR